jgi:hypothetical protein|tara:strand:- start:1290 stop:1433 length:144 start_codon:yes stop_codon:yes gene_type:complete
MVECRGPVDEQQAQRTGKRQFFAIFIAMDQIYQRRAIEKWNLTFTKR